MLDARKPLGLGESLARVHVASNRNPRFAVGALGGRFTLVCAVADLGAPAARAALHAIDAATFDETVRVCALFCGDAAGDALVETIGRSKLVFTDSDGAAARACGLHDPHFPEGRWLLFDPGLRVLSLWPLSQSLAALDALARTPAPDLHAGAPLHAPVLIAPRIFEPQFCAELIAYCDNMGATPSGVTKENAEGVTYVAADDAMKRRHDCTIEDARLREGAMHRIFWRLIPEVEKAFMWRATRMERYIVARYDAEPGGYFRPHRDNTTKGTAHRRFAVSLNLNTGAYEGGDLRFPEFGTRTYVAPPGGAVVFSCALLHEATPVTRGVRYAFLPFLYDEDGARLRTENARFLDESVGKYGG